MKKIFLKKQALVLTLVAALGTAVYLNYYFADHGIQTDGAAADKTLGEAVYVTDEAADGEKGEDAVAVGARVSYFEQARKNREKVRDEAVDLIKDIAADIQTDAEASKKALEKTTAIADAVTAETRIEELVKAKGLEDCVAYIAEDNCSVVVKAESLTNAQTLQIAEIVTAQTAIPAQNINIMAVKS